MLDLVFNGVKKLGLCEVALYLKWLGYIASDYETKSWI